MNRSKSSQRWIREHADDPFVKQARTEGYRSRAAFKLKEIQRQDRLIGRGMTVVDLGAGPGGWSQVAAEAVGPRGRVIALDLLPMPPIAGVDILQGDFREEPVLEQLRDRLGDRGADLVISDMAPNISGIAAVDQPRTIELAELALELAKEALRPDGVLLVKLFQGTSFDDFVREARRHFKRVKLRKPDSSRGRSREVYLVARQRKKTGSSGH